jgi:hypothetical protein
MTFFPEGLQREEDLPHYRLGLGRHIARSPQHRHGSLPLLRWVFAQPHLREALYYAPPHGAVRHYAPPTGPCDRPLWPDPVSR